MNTQKKHTIAIVIAIIAVVVILVTGILLISYWNTPIAKAESRTMQAIALQEDGSAEPCTVLISGISYHYLFRNHADSFEATEPGGVFVNGSRIMDSLILPSDIDSDWMFWQDDMLWCDAAGEQLIALLHRRCRRRVCRRPARRCSSSLRRRRRRRRRPFCSRCGRRAQTMQKRSA